MRRKRPDNGVSPVIGVVIMVAITVIMGVMIAEFTLNLTDRFTTEPDANVNFSQNIDSFQDRTYEVTVRIDGMSNSDYILVNPVSSEDDVTVLPIRVDDDFDNFDPENVDYAPDDIEDSSLSTDTGAVLIAQGDEAQITGVKAGDNIQIYGGIDGEEGLIREYTVNDAIPSHYDDD